MNRRQARELIAKIDAILEHLGIDPATLAVPDPEPKPSKA